MARGSWGQSKLLTQKSWTIVKDNRYLLAFPVLGFLASLVPLAMFWIPAGYLAISDQYVAAVALAIVGIFVRRRGCCGDDKAKKSNSSSSLDAR